ARIDKELQQLHAELTEYHAALMRPGDDEQTSFHELMGRWMDLPAVADVEFDQSLLSGVTPAALEAQTRHLHEVFERGVACTYASNPWVSAAGVPLAIFLATPMDRYRAAMAACATRAKAVDETASANIPAFAADEEVLAAAGAREKWAAAFEPLGARFHAEAMKKWAVAGAKIVAQESSRLQGVAAQVELIAHGA